MASTPQTAVIVDPHPLWLGAITPVVTACDLTVVATATSAEEGLRLVEEHQPDVLVTELEPGAGEGGARAIREVRERSNRTKTVVVSARRDMGSIDAALDAGAAAYVTKTAHPEDIASAIRQAFDQSLFLANRGSTHTAPHAASAAAQREKPAPDVDLTQRELTILQLAAEGHSNAELARRLWVTEQTVKFHLSNVYRKLGVSNRTEASRWAQLHGLLGAPESVESAA
jgi:NarL family two-component system response regulator LiaR